VYGFKDAVLEDADAALGRCIALTAIGALAALADAALADAALADAALGRCAILADTAFGVDALRGAAFGVDALRVAAFGVDALRVAAFGVDAIRVALCDGALCVFPSGTSPNIPIKKGSVFLFILDDAVPFPPLIFYYIEI
jgi:hypothetical protein